MVKISPMASSSAAMDLSPCHCKQLGTMKVCSHICHKCNRRLSHTGNVNASEYRAKLFITMSSLHKIRSGSRKNEMQ